MNGDARYLSEIARLRQQAHDLGHEAVETELSKLYNTRLLKRTAPLAMGQDGGRVVDRTGVNHDNIIHEFVF